MRQLGSSAFDAFVAVMVLVGVPAAAINREPVVIAVAVVAVVVLAARITVERRRARR